MTKPKAPGQITTTKQISFMPPVVTTIVQEWDFGYPSWRVAVVFVLKNVF